MSLSELLKPQTTECNCKKEVLDYDNLIKSGTEVVLEWYGNKNLPLSESAIIETNNVFEAEMFMLYAEAIAKSDKSVSIIDDINKDINKKIKEALTTNVLEEGWINDKIKGTIDKIKTTTTNAATKVKERGIVGSMKDALSVVGKKAKAIIGFVPALIKKLAGVKDLLPDLFAQVREYGIKSNPMKDVFGEIRPFVNAMVKVKTNESLTEATIPTTKLNVFAKSLSSALLTANSKSKDPKDFRKVLLLKMLKKQKAEDAVGYKNSLKTLLLVQHIIELSPDIDQNELKVKGSKTIKKNKTYSMQLFTYMIGNWRQIFFNNLIAVFNKNSKDNEEQLLAKFEANQYIKTSKTAFKKLNKEIDIVIKTFAKVIKAAEEKGIKVKNLLDFLEKINKDLDLKELHQELIQASSNLTVKLRNVFIYDAIAFVSEMSNTVETPNTLKKSEEGGEETKSEKNGEKTDDVSKLEIESTSELYKILEDLRKNILADDIKTALNDFKSMKPSAEYGEGYISKSFGFFKEKGIQILKLLGAMTRNSMVAAVLIISGFAINSFRATALDPTAIGKLIVQVPIVAAMFVMSSIANKMKEALVAFKSIMTTKGIDISSLPLLENKVLDEMSVDNTPELADLKKHIDNYKKTKHIKTALGLINSSLSISNMVANVGADNNNPIPTEDAVKPEDADTNVTEPAVDSKSDTPKVDTPSNNGVTVTHADVVKLQGMVKINMASLTPTEQKEMRLAMNEYLAMVKQEGQPISASGFKSYLEMNGHSGISKAVSEKISAAANQQPTKPAGTNMPTDTVSPKAAIWDNIKAHLDDEATKMFPNDPQTQMMFKDQFKIYYENLNDPKEASVKGFKTALEKNNVDSDTAKKIMIGFNSEVGSKVDVIQLSGNNAALQTLAKSLNEKDFSTLGGKSTIVSITSKEFVKTHPNMFDASNKALRLNEEVFGKWINNPAGIDERAKLGIMTNSDLASRTATLAKAISDDDSMSLPPDKVEDMKIISAKYLTKDNAVFDKFMNEKPTPTYLDAEGTEVNPKLNPNLVAKTIESPSLSEIGKMVNHADPTTKQSYQIAMFNYLNDMAKGGGIPTQEGFTSYMTQKDPAGYQAMVKGISNAADSSTYKVTSSIDSAKGGVKGTSDAISDKTPGVKEWGTKTWNNLTGSGDNKEVPLDANKAPELISASDNIDYYVDLAGIKRL